MIEVLCTRCMLRFDGMDAFRAHCAEVHPREAKGMAEIADLVNADLHILEGKR